MALVMFHRCIVDLNTFLLDFIYANHLPFNIYPTYQLFIRLTVCFYHMRQTDDVDVNVDVNVDVDDANDEK